MDLPGSNLAPPVRPNQLIQNCKIRLHLSLPIFSCTQLRNPTLLVTSHIPLKIFNLGFASDLSRKYSCDHFILIMLLVGYRDFSQPYIQISYSQRG